MDNEQNIIDEQWKLLPEDVRTALSSVPWKDRVRDIAKREALTADQTDNLETETLLMLYGFAPADTYVSNIVSQVGIPEDQAERIFNLVNAEIIADIEKYLDEPAQDQSSTKDLLNISPEILAKQVFLPETAPEMLPEVVPDETAHDVPHVEAAASVSTPVPVAESAPAVTVLAPQPTPAPATIPQAAPKSIVEEKLATLVSATPSPAANSYPQNADPYREPIE